MSIILEDLKTQYKADSQLLTMAMSCYKAMQLHQDGLRHLPFSGAAERQWPSQLCPALFLPALADALGHLKR